MQDLATSREQIDVIDRKIVHLFEERMVLSNEVAAYKKATNKPVYDPIREQEKLEKLQSMASTDFNKEAVEELFTQIMSLSRKYQYREIHPKAEIYSFQMYEKFPMDQNTKVCFFGPPGTHTQQAMMDFFGKDIKGISAPTFQSVMDQVEQEAADFGVLPIENSSTGGITANYDLLLDKNVYIVGEYIRPITQSLMGLPGASFEKATKVYSHPQGLMQCARFLSQYPNLQQIPCESTADAAKKVREMGDPAALAIAAPVAAHVYNLEILKDSIQQEQSNATRFIIIHHKPFYQKDSNKLALCFELKHECGSLYRTLSHFQFNHLNLSLIESRPIKEKNWEYRFFVDVEGNLLDPGVQNALRGIKDDAKKLMILGNFKAIT